MAPDMPQAQEIAPGRHAVHGTAVALDGRGLLILGPSGAGKSTLAAGLIALGARLVSDDRVDLVAAAEGPVLTRPATAPDLLELRGLGLVPVPTVPEAPFAAALLLGPSAARLPEAEAVPLGGHAVRLLRHPAGAELAAKLFLWLRAAP